MADWYEEMCKKTVAKRHAKTLPMSTDLDDLLRRPDEPSRDDGSSGGVTSLAAARSGDKTPPAAALTEAFDALAGKVFKGELSADDARAEAARLRDSSDEFDNDSGEVIDQGEYSENDDEQLPFDDKTPPPRAAGNP